MTLSFIKGPARSQDKGATLICEYRPADASNTVLLRSQCLPSLGYPGRRFRMNLSLNPPNNQHNYKAYFNFTDSLFSCC